MKVGIYLSKICLVILLVTSHFVYGQENSVILNPGVVSGSVSLNGYKIHKAVIKAIDINKVFSGSVEITSPEGVDSLDYDLTLEGDNQYYLMAEVYVVSEGVVKALIPPTDAVFVPIGGNTHSNISMSPVEIMGDISTGDLGEAEISYRLSAWLEIPEFEVTPWPYQSQSVMVEQTIDGDVGIHYTLLVAPDTQYYNVRAQITLNSFNYNINDTDVTSPMLGHNLVRNYLLDYDAATISGRSELLGVELLSAEVFGQAPAPLPRGTRTSIVNMSDSLFLLPVDEGVWNLTSIYKFVLPDDELADLTGLVYAGWPESVSVGEGESITRDFEITPGVMHGRLTLLGANTQFSQGRTRANGSPGGLSHSDISPETGDFIYVLPPGLWQTDNRLTVWFDYEDSSDTYLRSLIWQEHREFDEQIVVSGNETFDKLEMQFNTSKVKQLFSVTDNGELSHPYLKVTRLNSIQSIAQGYGSPHSTTLGQAVVTLLEPGNYLVEAFARVNDSEVEFGNTTISVSGGESIIIGGADKPVLKITSLIDGKITCEEKIIISGTATDLEGIESIYVNGISIPFTTTSNLLDSNEVSFHYNLTLSLAQENTIEIIALNAGESGESGETSITLKVTQENCTPDEETVLIDIKPGSCKNPVNSKSRGVIPLTIFGSESFDVSTVNIDSVRLHGVSPVKSAIEDSGQLLSESDCEKVVLDGFDDMTLKFRTQDVINALTSSEVAVTRDAVILLTLEGNRAVLTESIDFTGQDSIYIVNK